VVSPPLFGSGAEPIPPETVSRMLRGNHPARIDDKGRFKVPNSFRSTIETQWGKELFVTSVTGEFVRVYPMAVWLEIEQRLAAVPSAHPSKMRFLERVNFFGQAATMDRQGRILIPQMLRESAAMAGEVSVLGQQNFLAVWNLKRLQERLFKRDPFTDEDGRLLSEHGI